jgi:hypothetical protein
VKPVSAMTAAEEPAAQVTVVLGVIAPAKSVSEMTIEERKAFAKSVADMIRARYAAAVEAQTGN